MRSRFRSALMWLLFLALPFQGLAAATMLGCGPVHERMAATANAHAAAHSHAGDHAHRHAGDTHADADAHAGHGAQAAGGSDDAVAHHLGPLGKLKCSACAACCVGAALPTAEVAVAAVPPAFTPALFVKPQHVDFLSGTLDRPPRILTA